MKRQWKLVLCLMMAALLLTSCSGGGTPNQPIFPEITQNLGLPQVTDVPTPEPTAEPTPEPGANDDGSVFTDNPFDGEPEYSETDPLTEESYQEPVDLSESISGNYTVVEETEYVYAGSTPIPLDPVDMPTPTPRPPVNFTYVTYTAGSLGLSFEAPSGWIADDSLTEVYSVIEPAEQMVGGQQCVVTIVAVPVNTNYDQRDLEKEVKARLNDISATNFASWEPSLTATRHLMGGMGVYANYSGELVNGVKLGGRIHYVCINNMLYGVEIMYPREYREDYMNIFDKIKETLKTI
ncbi:MAG: hypothetical protein J6K73_10820 [Clostridia bacterium]|nr:hypothetical protein [Clostridia bacterium]MBP3650260.1 hypothetical protein [Clostridia bacterium]